MDDSSFDARMDRSFANIDKSLNRLCVMFLLVHVTAMTCAVVVGKALKPLIFGS